MARLSRQFYNRPTLEVARDLLGQRLVRLWQGQRLAGLISEVEAYIGQTDLACHARFGRTPRSEVMIGAPGHAYVYFTYGMHVVVDDVEAQPGAALIQRQRQPIGKGLFDKVARHPTVLLWVNDVKVTFE